MRGFLPWLPGIPIPIIILLYLFDVIRPEVKSRLSPRCGGFMACVRKLTP